MPPPAWRATLIRWFFRRFFRLLLIGISVSEAALLWWFTNAFIEWSPVVYLTLAPLLYIANQRLATAEQKRRRLQGPVGALPGFYYAFAFSALFGFAFLLMTGAAWATVKVALGAITAEALTVGVQSSLASSSDRIFHWVANIGVASIGLSFVYGYTIGQRRLVVRNIPVAWRNAPMAWKGLRIAQISDIHVGQNMEPEQLRGFVERVNALAPDLVCITGDIADSVHSDLDRDFPILAGLRAKYGVVAILGNHDHYAGPDRVVAALERHTSFSVLRDSHITIAIRGHDLHILGMDDRGPDWARGPGESIEFEQALDRLQRPAPILLLVHRPDLFHQAAHRGVGLMLSGHTHGGQIGMPWFGGRTRNLAEFITRFDRGLFESQGNYLYVNCGLGVTGQRVRLSTPREISVLEICPTVTADI